MSDQAPPPLELLQRAAAACGVELSYTDIWGHVHEPTSDVLLEILPPLGIATGSQSETETSLREYTERHWRQPVNSTVVVREDTEAIELRVPAERNGASAKLEIEWENGDLEHHWFWMPELTTEETVNVATADGEARDFLRKRLPLPKVLRLGYHRIRLYWMEKPELVAFAEAFFIVCPKRAKAVERKLGGLALSLYGLRSQRNWGCGDFTDLRAVIDAFAPAGAAFIALNPLHALSNRQPYNISPYLPECSFYRNYIYLDVEKVAATTAGGLKLLEKTRKEIAALQAAEFVEYERIAKLKLYVLGKVFDTFIAKGGAGEFDQFVLSEDQLLDDYAVFCALWEEMHRRDEHVWLWLDWPAPYRDPRSPEVAAFAQKHRKRVLFFKFLHWQLSVQASETHAYALAKGMPIGLYHDLALATDRSGADAWAQKPFFIPRSKVGAPPDALAPSGQDWGFPPPNREHHRDDGYRLFAQSIRRAAAQGGALRIDHVMRFFRLYWIPEHCDATKGVYVRDYPQDLLGILDLESVQNNFVVIGEDLGTVTDEVRHTLADKGVLSYRLMIFERDASGRFHSPGEYPAHALASTTTHDLPTMAGFVAYRDIEARKAAGLADEAAYQSQKAERAQEIESLARALRDAGFDGDPIGFLFATPCLLAAVTQEDLTGELDQQNLPGSTWQYPNWRRKMKVAIEDLAPLAEKFAKAARQSGRAWNA